MTVHTALLLVSLVVSGRVRDAVTLAPVAGVTVRVAGTPLATISDDSGRFSLDAPSGARLRLSRLGYTTLEVVVTGDSLGDLRLVPSIRALEGVTVTALRGYGAGRDAPITDREITKAEIERSYSGQEMPILLSALPSMTAYADNGAYSNYTYFRLRGIDQTRINITLDGVPMNDMEDQGVFFSNFPDFGNSIQSVQVQRGVGTSSQGTAPYAGSINFESISLANAPRGGELQVGGGSYGTYRGSAEWQSGMLGNRYAVYGRVSSQQTDGYRDHSGNRSAGGFVSAGYFGARDLAKLTAFTGVSRNELSYVAASEAEVRGDPRINPLGESDRFRSSLVSLAYTRAIGESGALSATAYTFDAGGDYDVRIEDALWNFNLESRVSGGFVNWNAQLGAITLALGAHASTYYRDHWLYIPPDLGTPAYVNTGHKDDASAFAKMSYDAGAFTIFGDVQARRVWYRYVPDENAGIGERAIRWDFVNPKLGVSYRPAARWTVYASVGRNGREPTRNDMFAGFDNLDTTNADFVGPFERVRPERVLDTELGAAYRSSALTADANLYAMEFRNEITPIGALSYIGLPLRKNVRRSYRRGVEGEVVYRGLPRWTLGANAALSWNRIAEYTDDASQATFHDVEPLLTPRVVTNQRVEFRPLAWLSVLADGRYVSRSFLANTGDARFTTPGYYVLDGGVRWSIGTSAVLFQVRNLTDVLAFTSGYTDGTTSYVYPLAGRNVSATVVLRVR
jgi:iron complex outermembrane receptor protein